MEEVNQKVNKMEFIVIKRFLMIKNNSWNIKDN